MPVDPTDPDLPLYGASPLTAYARFWKRYVVFSGRASLSEYWWTVLLSAIVATVLGVLGAVLLGVGGALAQQGFGHLRAGTVAGAQKQHRCPHGHPRGWRWRQSQPGMQRRADGGQELPAAGQVQVVVAVPGVGRTASRVDQAGLTQLAQVIGDQVLRLTEQGGQLVHGEVAVRQFADQPPPHGMPDGGRERRRCGGAEGPGRHDGRLHQINLME